MTAVPMPSTIAPSTNPKPVRWTCLEFHRLGDLGMFEGRRAMLIEGVILEQGPTNPPHAITLELVEAALRPLFATGWRVRIQMPLLLGQDTDPEPDLALVTGNPRDHSGHPQSAELVIEVADSSFRFDTTDKVRLYAKAGIRDYWVIDISGRELLVYRDPQGDDYASRRNFRPSEVISPLAAPAATIRVADMLM